MTKFSFFRFPRTKKPRPKDPFDPPDAVHKKTARTFAFLRFDPPLFYSMTTTNCMLPADLPPKPSPEIEVVVVIFHDYS